MSEAQILFKVAMTQINFENRKLEHEMSPSPSPDDNERSEYRRLSNER